MAKTDNPWPSVEAMPLTPPVAVLRSLAGMLGEQTKNVVLANVETWSRPSQDTLYHTLKLRAPGLGGMTVDVATVQHPLIRPYPCQLSLTLRNDGAEPVDSSLKNDDELRTSLRAFLSSPPVAEAISALYWQSVSVE